MVDSRVFVPWGARASGGCLAILGALLIGSARLCAAATQLDGYTYPAEWERHEAIWIGFRTEEAGIAHEPLLQQMFKSLTPHVRVKALVEDSSLLPEGRAYFPLIGLAADGIDIIVEKPVDFWIRDPGPLFLVGNRHQLAVADFLYSNYANVPPEAYSPRALAHEQIDEAIARRLGVPVVESRAALEGGAFEVNGRGTILLTETTAKRNPHLTRSQLEHEILTTLGQKKVIWLNEGLAEDPLGFARIAGRYWGRGAGGHTDEFVRFADEHTVLLAWPTETQQEGELPLAGMNARRMAENQALLNVATDQDGRPFTIVHFPVPEPLLTPYQIPADEIDLFRAQDPTLVPGDTIFLTAAASYLNYVVTNGVVLLPSYWEQGRPDIVREQDQQARRIVERYFPERKIIQLNPTTLNVLGGGMHCIVQQQPKVSD